MQDKQMVTGTLFKAMEETTTLVGHVLAHIANGRYVFGWNFDKMVGYPYSNTSSLIWERYNRNVLLRYPTEKEVSSSFTGKAYDPDASVIDWQSTFDLLLYDAAYSALINAADSLVTAYAQEWVEISAEMWRRSAQLRRDVGVYEARHGERVGIHGKEEA